MGKATETTKPDASVTTIDDEVSTTTSAPEASAQHVHVAEIGGALSGERMELTINQGEGEIGKQAVFLSLNGHAVLVPRGVKCNVPAELVEVLQNATQVVYEKGANNKMVEREINRFAFTARPAPALSKNA